MPKTKIELAEEEHQAKIALWFIGTFELLLWFYSLNTWGIPWEGSLAIASVIGASISAFPIKSMSIYKVMIALFAISIIPVSLLFFKTYITKFICQNVMK